MRRSTPLLALLLAAAPLASWANAPARATIADCRQDKQLYCPTVTTAAAEAACLTPHLAQLTAACRDWVTHWDSRTHRAKPS